MTHRKWEPVDLGDPELNREVNMLSAQMDDSPSVWWHLSFCDTSKPAGTKFLGVAIVQAPNGPMAMREAWVQKCNPGGEIALWEVPPVITPPPEFCNRLLSRADLDALKRKMESE